MQVCMGSSCYSLKTEGFGELSPGTDTAGFSADNRDRGTHSISPLLC